MRIIRNQFLTKKEEDKYNLIRKQISQEMLDLIKRHHERCVVKIK